MRVKMNVSNGNYDKLKKIFEENGFIITDDYDFLFIEKDYNKNKINVIDPKGASRIIDIDDVCIIESTDYKNQLTTKSGNKFYIHQKLYEFESEAYKSNLVRINKSTVIGISSISKISPQFNSRLKVKLINESTVFVTRRYIYNFRITIDEWRK